MLSSCPNAILTKVPSEVIHRYSSETNVYKIRAIFEVRVRSQSLCGADSEIDEGNSAQIWTTKEAGACILTALLLRLEPDDIRDN